MSFLLNEHPTATMLLTPRSLIRGLAAVLTIYNIQTTLPNRPSTSPNDPTAFSDTNLHVETVQQKFAFDNTNRHLFIV